MIAFFFFCISEPLLTPFVLSPHDARVLSHHFLFSLTYGGSTLSLCMYPTLPTHYLLTQQDKG